MKKQKKTTKQTQQNQPPCDHQVARIVHEPKVLDNPVEVCACGAFRIVSKKGTPSSWYEVPEGRNYRLKTAGYQRDDEGLVLYREAYALALSLQEGQEKFAYESYTEDELTFDVSRRNGSVRIYQGTLRPGWW